MGFPKKKELIQKHMVWACVHKVFEMDQKTPRYIMKQPLVTQAVLKLWKHINFSF